MVDLHCHILPGVDDGSASDEESCMMAQLAADSGVTVIAATPHCNVRGCFDNYDSDALRERFLHLARLLRQNQIPIGLRTGMEVYVTPEVPELIRRKQLLTLGGSHYLLVEFGFRESGRYADHMLKEIMELGLIPVVAHPERYEFVQEERERLLRWIEAGYVLQLNKGSLFGFFGRRVARTAHWCLGEGCVHLIGSDAHSPYRRTTRLGDVHEYVAEHISPEIADFLLEENPLSILNDEPIRPVLAQF